MALVVCFQKLEFETSVGVSNLHRATDDFTLPLIDKYFSEELLQNVLYYQQLSIPRYQVFDLTIFWVCPLPFRILYKKTTLTAWRQTRFVGELFPQLYFKSRSTGSVLLIQQYTFYRGCVYLTGDFGTLGGSSLTRSISIVYVDWYLFFRTSDFMGYNDFIG